MTREELAKALLVELERQSEENSYNACYVDGNVSRFERVVVDGDVDLLALADAVLKLCPAQP